VSATVTVSLPDELKRDLDEVAKEEGATPSEIVLRSISKYVFLRRFDAACAEAEAAARKQGIYTDEDVWKRLGTSR
jgi:predicted transcriptional regulator